MKKFSVKTGKAPKQSAAKAPVKKPKGLQAELKQTAKKAKPKALKTKYF